MRLIFEYLFFPGFLFTATVGLLASWVDRKITARLQWRKGPPWYQNFVDIIKLLGKETIVPRSGAKLTFLASPILGLASITLVSSIIGIVNIWPDRSFIGDLIVILYLLTLPSISLILAGFASANPLASLGASREIKLILAYELPFILAVFTPVIKTGGLIKLGQILRFQESFGIMLTSPSCIIAFVITILCMQAKLGIVPFDIPEAEQEIMAGPYIEYSGSALAIFKLTKAMMLFVLPFFLVEIFMGGIKLAGISFVLGILKYAALLVVIILIKNTSTRLRIDQAIKFFWGPVTLLAIIAVVLAVLGQ